MLHYVGVPRNAKTIFYLYPIDQSGKPVGNEISLVDEFLDKAVDAVGGTETLGAAIDPIQCYTGYVQTNHTKKKDRLPTIVFVRDAEAGMRVLPDTKKYCKLDTLLTNSDSTYRPYVDTRVGIPKILQ